MIATDNTTVVAYINKQGGTHSHTLLYLAVDLFLRQQTQDVAIRARSKRDRSSGPPILAEPAHNNRVKAALQNSDPDLRDVGNSNTGHACLPQHAFSPFCVSNPRALSIGDRCSVTRLAGKVNVHVSTIPLLSKVMQKLRTTQEGEVILIAPWWPSQPWCPHLLRFCVNHPLFFPYSRDLLSQQGYVSDGKLYACLKPQMQQYQTAGFSRRSLDLWHPLEDPQHTECTTTGGFATLTGPQDKELIRLFPQLLK